MAHDCDQQVEGLLVKEPTKRLGCGSDGVRGIQRSAFFRVSRILRHVICFEYDVPSHIVALHPLRYTVLRTQAIDWAVLNAKKAPSPLRRDFFVREPVLFCP